MLKYSLGISTLLFVSYGIVFIFGILGNIILLITIFKTASLKTTTNIFIGNLAIADLLVTVFCIPFTLASNLLADYPFGAVICKLVAYIQAVAINASVNSLVAISIDRYFFINKPFGFTKQKRLLILIIIWLLPILYMSPWLIVFKVKKIDADEDYTLCTDFWKNKQIQVAYFITVNLCLSYLLPLFIISVFYIMIFLKIHSRHIPGEICPTQRKMLRYKSKIKIIKMVFIVIITFTVSWLPLYVLFIIVKVLGNVNINSKIIYFRYLFPAAQWLATSNSCINPIIYTFYSRKFRNEFKNILNNISLFRKNKTGINKESIIQTNQECIMLSFSEIIL